MTMEYQQEQLEPIPPEQPERGDVEELPSRQYCIFRAGRERFCVPVMDVEEVVEWPSVTRVPLAPSFLMGVFNLRGSIVPIVDIAFTEGRHPDLPPRHVVVGLLPPEEGRDAMRIGIAADQVIGTYVTADALMIEEAPRDVPHCCGMLRHEDKLALALDVRRVAEVFPVPVI